MKASNLVICLIGSAVLGVASGTASAQDAGGANCNAVASAADHDSVYDPLNGVTNTVPVGKASGKGWKKRGAIETRSCGSNAAADAVVPAHDTIYDPLNGITNDAPVNKVSRMGWKS